MTELAYVTADPGRIDDIAYLISHAFGSRLDDAAEWVKATALSDFRCVTHASRTLGTVLHIPMGMFFGGRPVPCTGIAGVAIAPDARGQGVARRMMHEVVREIAEQGVALSGLYSAMHPLYHGCGYETAGSRFEYRVPLYLFPGVVKQPGARPARAEDRPAIEKLASAYAAMHPGHLLRGPYIWRRIERPRGSDAEAAAFVFDDPSQPDQLEAVIYTMLQRNAQAGTEITLRIPDIAAISPSGWRRAASFLRGSASIPTHAVFYGGPAHPLLGLLTDRRYTTTLTDHWMLRIINAPSAIAQRGFAPGVSIAVEMVIDDDLLELNRGGWRLLVADGRGTLERASADATAARMNIRALAPLYSGFRSAAQLAMLGMIEADARTVAALDAAFAGPYPSTPDFY
ncbi:MAG: GNAT family N-acetyltransferase [Phycisphaeraceae bacterium]|nr:GNAT family N-acetyltransferase [Phycisphaeraceae bacterium]MCW5753111.1 GNAT family N-acetyltransferase [Phycisphaeraceae bacterium]